MAYWCEGRSSAWMWNVTCAGSPVDTGNGEESKRAREGTLEGGVAGRLRSAPGAWGMRKKGVCRAWGWRVKEPTRHDGCGRCR